MASLNPWIPRSGAAVLLCGLLWQNWGLRQENARLVDRSLQVARHAEVPRPGLARLSASDRGGAGLSDRESSSVLKPKSQHAPSKSDTGSRVLEVASDPKVAGLIETRAKELADELVEERRSERMEQIQDRIEEKVLDYAEESGWAEELSTQVLELAMERFEDHWMLRTEVEAGELTRDEAHAEHMRRGEEREARLAELLGEEEAGVFIEEMRPPHHRAR
jgi:hypothetical protein